MFHRQLGVDVGGEVNGGLMKEAKLAGKLAGGF